MLLLAAGVVVVSVSVVVLVVAASFAHRRVTDPRISFLRVVSASGVMSVGAGVMYLIDIRLDGDRIVATVADTALAVSAGMLAVAVSTVRERLAQIVSAFTAAAGLIVAASSATLRPDASLIVLLWVLALTCGACAVLTARNTALPRRPKGVISLAIGGYAVYCTCRAMALIVLDRRAPVVQVLFTLTPSVAAAIVTNLLVTGAVIALFLPTARARRRRSRSSVTLTVNDWPLVLAAYGPARALQLVSELREAIRDADPLSIDVPHGIETTLPAPLQTLTNRLSLEYGWRPEEIALLVTDQE